MDIINAYVEPVPTKNLVYLAKPVYGGWVTFTGHLSKKYNYPIHKLTKHTERGERDFGYECMYRNMALQDLIALPNLLICAVDKHFWDVLKYFPKGTGIVIHDPTECKTSKEGNPLIQESTRGSHLLKEFKVYVIRESVKDYLSHNFDIQATFLHHPFCETTVGSTMKGLPFKNVSVARLDFDKHTDILLQANQQLIDANKPPIYLFGSENRLYVYHKLTSLKFHDYWKGKFPKTIEPSQQGCSILKDAKYMIDMSIIKQDGGGTQYSFLEAIHGNCVLILHTEWVSNPHSVFTPNVNCLAVSNANELAKILIEGIEDKLYDTILKNSQRLLSQHPEVQW